MKLFLPTPGVLAVAAATEIGIIVAGVGEEPSIRSILFAVGLGLPVLVLGWFANDHFALRRERVKDREEFYRAMGERHEENQRVADEHARVLNHKIEELSAKMDPVMHLVLGVQGKEGYMDERNRNRDRRHELANAIHGLQMELHMMGRVLQEVCGKVGISYEPPDMPSHQHRRHGDPG